MNENHARVCPSQEWAEHLQGDVMPRALDGVNLGASMLEVGPGPGASTDLLRHRVQRLVALELEEPAADRLCQLYTDGNVEIVVGDATAMAFEGDSFDSVACFTMLHHVPTVTQQNRMLSEILRVLRPGGVLVGSDSLASVELHDFHEGDVYNPIEPAVFLVRLQTLGFDRLTIGVHDELTFVAHKPE
jgi:ubiquinone/menaquinone biosynthesis C-methylase UbiE